MRVCIYLRKSRADEEIERDLGQGETLAKHRKALLKYAAGKKLDIIKIYEEIVSGESLIHRPEMLKMLGEIEKNMYDAVLCMDMQRLGRGNMQEQGLILQTFKEHNTKIITLQKTYDLNDDFDEEYSEFEAFMSRKELKMINRRLQSGRLRSIEEGNYLSPLPPYGYNIKEGKHFRTLDPDEEQSSVVRLVFDMYVNKNMGYTNIARELNKLGYKSYTGKDWEPSIISNIIKNPVYIGKITWKKKDIKKSKKPNKIKETRTRPRKQWIIVNGKHPSIIDKNTFYAANSIMKGKYHTPYKLTAKIRNPLAGIVICSNCGSKMVYRSYKTGEPHIICARSCGNKSSKFIYIESRMLDSIESLLQNLELNIKLSPQKLNPNLESYKKHLKSLINKLNELKSQENNLFDLFERGIYDIDTFTERSKNVSSRIEDTKKVIDIIKNKIEVENNTRNIEDYISKIKNVLDAYKNSNSIAEKNLLLKNVINKAVYKKRKDQKNDEFSLVIYPRIIF